MVTMIAALQIAIRLYDTAGVATPTMAEARAASARILGQAGLEPVWRDCTAGCGDTLRPGELVVRLVRAGGAGGPERLGYALVDVSAQAGSLATVFADRVQALSAEAGVDPGTLLGRTLAHEIGHMLLGSSAHAGHGLMRARWDERELRRDRPGDWRFSGSEADVMRRRVAARTRESLHALCVPCTPCLSGTEACALPGDD